MKLKSLFVVVFMVVFLGSSTAQVNRQPPVSTPPVTGILGAFPEEVRVLLSKLDHVEERVIQQLRFTTGMLNGRKVVVAHSGIGKVNAAVSTTLLIDHFKPNEIIFTGIAGGTDPALEPGDIVIGTQITYHDYGSIDGDKFIPRPTRHAATMADNPVYFKADSTLLMLASKASRTVMLEKMQRNNQQVKPQIVQGVIVTGDVFVASPSKVEWLHRELKASATEMEGAAVAQVCWQQNVPLIVIRSLSDRADKNASADVRTFYKVAAANSAGFVIELVGLIKP